MTGRRVLLADDVTAVLRAVAELVQDSFEIVGMVSDGKAALDAALALQPDLIVLDVSMPEMSGIEVARELSKLGSRSSIVFLTVHEDADIRAACLAAGGLGYVAKVLIETDLIPAMNSALSGREYVSKFSSEQDLPNNT